MSYHCVYVHHVKSFEFEFGLEPCTKLETQMYNRPTSIAEKKSMRERERERERERIKMSIPDQTEKLDRK